MSMILRDQTEESTFDLLARAGDLASKIAATEFVPQALRNRPAAVLAAILTGHEVGLGPMASLAQICVIEGKPTMSAAAMRALVLSHGHDLWFDAEFSISRVTAYGRRKGTEEVVQVTWTMDDVKRAGLAGRQNYTRYPRQMLTARCTAELARLIFADVLAGIAYATEELQDEAGVEGPSLVALPATTEAPASATGVKRRARRTKAEERESEPPPEPAIGEETPAPEPLAPQSPPEEPPLPDAPPEAREISVPQQIAMLCRELGINRVTLIEAVTKTKDSARELTPAEAAEVMKVARGIGRGELHFERTDADGWAVVPVLDGQRA